MTTSMTRPVEITGLGFTVSVSYKETAGFMHSVPVVNGTTFVKHVVQLSQSCTPVGLLQVNSASFRKSFLSCLTLPYR